MRGLKRYTLPISKLFHRLFLRSRSPTPEPGDAIFRSMVEQSADVFCYLVNDSFAYVSPSAGPIFGWDPQAMIDTDGLDLIYEPDLPILKDVLARRTSGKESGPIRHQLRVICSDGSLKWSETSAHSERTETGEMRTVLIIRDISDRKHLEQKLEALAMKDGLTGLANRRCFDEVLDRSWRQTLRQGGEMALLLLDVDNFKQFNDLYGHQAGDDCLRDVAKALAGFARRPTDLACRYGGEEFAIVLGDTERRAAVDIAEGVRLAVAALAVPHAAKPGPGYVTVSIGVAIAQIGGSIREPENLLQAADDALYKAKAAGRNRVEEFVSIAPPMGT